MDCDLVRDEIEAYALGALDPAASRRIEAHLRTCTFCNDLVRAYALTVDHLAYSAPVVRAPRRLKERVLGSVGAFRPIVTPATLVRTSRWWAAAAAVFLIFGIGAVAWAFTLSTQLNDLKQDNARLSEASSGDAEQRDVALLQVRSELASAQSQQRVLESALADQAALIVLAMDAELVPTDLQGTSSAPEAQCRYVWSSKQATGALTCQKLPDLSPALTYNLWSVRGGERIVNMGPFVPREDGSAYLLVRPSGESGPITNMFVTLESITQLPRQPSSEVVLERVQLEQPSQARENP